MQTFAPHTRLLALGANFVLYGVVSFRCASSSLVRSVNRRSSSFPFSLRSFLSPLIRRTSNRCRFSVLSLWGDPYTPMTQQSCDFLSLTAKKRTVLLSSRKNCISLRRELTKVKFLAHYELCTTIV